MRCAERLHTAFRQGNACGDLIKLLIRIGRFDVRGDARADRRFEISFDCMLDNEHDFIKPGAQRVIHRIIDYEAAFRVNGIHLLDASAIAAAHAGREDGQNRFLHVALSFVN